MNKCYILVLLIIGFLYAFTQKKASVIDLIQSEKVMIVKDHGRDLLKVYKGIFQQDNCILRSDSAYFYPQDNFFDAFGHVQIHQSDSISIYADQLSYDGPAKLAKLIGNVCLVDNAVTLRTNYLTYNTATRIGTYIDGGQLVNQQDTLLSKQGYYLANTRNAYFRYGVVLKSAGRTVQSDTMRYHTDLKTAYFYGPTCVYSTYDTIYTDYGYHYTSTKQTYGLKHNYYQQGPQTLRGDTLFYDHLKGLAYAKKNITFYDAYQNILFKGHLAHYYKHQERVVLTDNPYVVLVIKRDSAYIHRDSIFISADTLTSRVLASEGLKSLQAQPKSVAYGRPTIDSKPKNDGLSTSDTARVRIIQAYHKVKVYKNDLQAKTDSVFYSTSDSTLHCYKTPMIWTKEAQLSADTMSVQLKNDKLYAVYLINNSFIVHTTDTLHFNQVAGRNMYGYFRNEQLETLLVDGNAESLFFYEFNKQEANSTPYATVSHINSSRIRIGFEDKGSVAITFLDKPDGITYDIHQVTEAESKLAGFVWKPEERPISKETVTLRTQ